MHFTYKRERCFVENFILLIESILLTHTHKTSEMSIHEYNNVLLWIHLNMHAFGQTKV